MYITRKQKAVLDFIKSYLSRHGIAPTYEEIAAFFGYRSKGTVHKHVSALEERGYITKDWNRSRGIQVVEQSGEAGKYELPLLGLVAAGEPIEAIEQQELISVPADMLGNGTHYVLRVAGESMIEEHIQDGDYVIVQPRETAENGEMVVALIDGQDATLKRFYREKEMIRLQPANAAMSPLLKPADSVTIRGVVIGVMRKY